jgi:hypothetical protein
MNMHVGYDSHIGVAAYLPNDPEFAAVKLYDPIVKTARINVVVIQKPVNDAYALVRGSKEKRSTFSVTSGSATKFVNTLVPETLMASEFRWLAERVVPECSK